MYHSRVRDIKPKPVMAVAAIMAKPGLFDESLQKFCITGWQNKKGIEKERGIS
jgi:hypothetical protein